MTLTIASPASFTAPSTALFTAAQVQAVDAAAIAAGTAAFTLMCRAGEVAFEVLRQRWPASRSLLVLAGPGNNGGDGLVIAALAQAAGLRVQVLHCGDPDRLRGAAREALEQAAAQRVKQGVFSVVAFQQALADDRELILIDALLGTGSRGDPHGLIAEAIDSMILAGRPVLAVDLPSGLDPDTGAGHSVVPATVTVSFIALKQGMFTGRGPACCGEIIVHDLGLDRALLPPAAARLVNMQSVVRLFPARLADTHKGDCGRVVVVGGELGFGGAVMMAAEAAARAGAGTVAVLTRSAHVQALLARRPEIMVLGVEDVAAGQEAIAALLRSASIIVAGPGMGKSIWARGLLQQVLAAGKPLVLDADALNLLAESGASHCRRSNWILTPHPGEAARLLACEIAEVQADRFAAVRALQQRFGGSCVLKGAGSLLCYEQEGRRRVDICSEGNPGMASGGMGDVLSGIIAAFAAQGLGLADSLRAGVCVHGEAADVAAQRRGQRGLLATDLFAELGALINPTLMPDAAPDRRSQFDTSSPG